MKPKKRNPGTIFLIVVILFIPLLVVGLIVRQNLQGGLSSGKIVRAELIFADTGEGEETVILEEESEIALFVNAVEKGVSVEKPAKPIEEYEKISLIFHKLREDFSYMLYFSASASDCLFTDEEGVLYHIPREEAEPLLLQSAIYARVMPYVQVPEAALQVEGKAYGAAKVSGEWIHRKADGSEDVQEIAEEPGESAALPAGSTFEAVLNLEPDFCSVRILSEKGDILYSGSLEELTPLKLEDEQHLQVFLNCDWYVRDDRAYHGSLEYEFDTFYDQPVTHALSGTEMQPGGTFELTLQFSQSETIAVTATFASGEIQETVSGGSRSFQIPVAGDAVPGEYAILVMGSDVELNLAVTITAP